MKARCKHGAPWFRDDCPDCLAEHEADHGWPRQVMVTFPFWRAMRHEDALALIEREADHHAVVAQIRKAKRSLFLNGIGD